MSLIHAVVEQVRICAYKREVVLYDKRDKLTPTYFLPNQTEPGKREDILTALCMIIEKVNYNNNIRNVLRNRRRWVCFITHEKNWVADVICTSRS
jgi:hypothetical protein